MSEPAANKIHLMNQMASGDLHRSPLHRVDVTADGGSELRFTLRERLAHLVIRGASESLAPAVQAAFGLALPIKPLTSSNNGDLCLRWVSPDEWLLTGPESDALALERGLRDACSDRCAVVNVSGGQLALTLSGPAAKTVLMKSVPYDLHPDNFPIDKVVTVTLAKGQCLLRRIEADAFEMIVRRSFADYLWDWLADAGSEFDVAVVRDQ
ncbi:MAG: sarcosine oxidase subunit gamma family protein [Pseudomonadota bacterium]